MSKYLSALAALSLLFACTPEANKPSGTDEPEGGKDKTVHVTGIQLNPTSATIKEGEYITLVATVTPSNADNKTVSWSSSSDAVAKVDASGKVTGVMAGSATITATTEDGGKTASCTVTVLQNNAPSVTIGADYISPVSAVLHGKANLGTTMASDVKIGFQYSKSAGILPSNSTTIEATDADASYNYTAAITGLDPDTKYYFRSFVRQNGQDTYGETKEFTTKSLSSLITTQEATAVTSTSATLNGTVDLSDVSVAYKTIEYGFSWSTSKSHLSTNLSSGDIVGNAYSAPLTLLSRGTQYWYTSYVKLDSKTFLGEVKTFTTKLIEDGDFPSGIKKIFILNEGMMDANNATLDVLSISEGLYVIDAFKKMNPSATAGLGDIGNDIAIHNDKVWMVINNSGLVKVISAVDETEVATIEIPTPRAITFDDKYAYVTSWAGAFVTYEGYDVRDFSNPEGCVYRINLSTYKVEGSVKVGYQPEGIACYGGKLYVANSGVISSQLPPLYAYDNTVSIIDAANFTSITTVTVQVNLKNVYADDNGHILVTSLGNYYDVHSGLYMFSEDVPEQVMHVTHDSWKHTHVTCSFALGEEVYCIGTENEFYFGGKHSYVLWSFNASEDKATLYPLTFGGTPYGMGVVADEAGLRMLLVGDAGDYYNPGSVIFYNNNGGELLRVTAGVCPGHFAIWK